MKLTKKWRAYNEDQIKKGKSPEPKFPLWLEFIYKGAEYECEKTHDSIEESRKGEV